MDNVLLGVCELSKNEKEYYLALGNAILKVYSSWRRITLRDDAFKVTVVPV